MLKLYNKYIRYLNNRLRYEEDDSFQVRLHSFHLIYFISYLIVWSNVYWAVKYSNSILFDELQIIIASVISLTPLIIIAKRSLKLANNTLLLGYFSFALIWTYFSGGFFGSTIILFSILPLVAGILDGIQKMFVWIGVVLFTILIFYLIHFFGIELVNVIPPEGWIYIRGTFRFTYLISISSIMILFIHLKNRYVEVLKDQSMKIENLLRSMCHDMTTPLLKIKMLMEELHDKPFEKEDLHSIAMVRQFNEVILDQVETIKQRYKNTEIEENITLTEVNFIELLGTLRNLYDSWLKEKNIVFEVQDSTASANIEANYNILLIQVLSNLLSNAIKFSFSGQKIVCVLTENSGNLSIELIDFGIGIPTVHQTQLFQRKLRYRQLGTHQEVGQGFGLNLAKYFTEKMGGKFSLFSKAKIESTVEHGTRIQLLFPLKK